MIMSKIVYDAKCMKLMSSFEFITRAKIKDIIENNEQNLILFVVNPGEIIKAVGPKGANVKRLEQKFRKKIKIVEFSPELANFIKNLVYPLKVADIISDNGVYTMTPVDSKTRSILIGKNACNLRFYESVIKRYFKIEELRVGKQNG